MNLNHRFVVLLLCFFGKTTVFAQNQKLDGYHKVFLDKNLNKTDSSNAYFWAFEFYDEGKIISEKFPPSKYYKNCELIFDGTLPAKGSPIAVNGVFKWLYHKEVIEENTCKDGYVLIIKEFTTNELSLLIDFTKTYNNEEGSSHFTDYLSYTFSSDKRKKTTCYWYRKVNNEWKRLETPCE